MVAVGGEEDDVVLAVEFVKGVSLREGNQFGASGVAFHCSDKLQAFSFCIGFREKCVEVRAIFFQSLVKCRNISGVLAGCRKE